MVERIPKAVRLAFSLLIVTACTAEPPQMAPGATVGSADNHPPVVHSLTLAPDTIIRQGVVTAVVETKDQDHDEVQLRYRWLINDAPVLGVSTSTFNPEGLRKGDRLSVEVTPYDGKVEGQAMRSADRVVGNTPPIVRTIVLGPLQAKVGDSIAATVDGGDADGDMVRYTYRWWRNDQIVSDGEQDSIKTSEFSTNDVVAVAVIPHDHVSQGKEVKSEPVVLANRSPRFTSAAPPSIVQGLFAYVATAEDPENDPVTFSLESAPPGMTIDEQSGRIQWSVPTALSGSFRVKVVAKDNRNAWASQEFEISLKQPSAS